MFIAGVVSNLPLYILSILIGTAVTAGMLFVLKRPIEATSKAEEEKRTVVAAA